LTVRKGSNHRFFILIVDQLVNTFDVLLVQRGYKIENYVANISVQKSNQGGACI